MNGGWLRAAGAEEIVRPRRADGSSVGKLIPTLQAEGHEVIAAQYGLDLVATPQTPFKNLR